MRTFKQFLKNKLDEADLNNPVVNTEKLVQQQVGKLATTKPNMPASKVVRTALLDTAQKTNPAAVNKLQNDADPQKMKKKMKKK